jgi:hypothetical protein
VIETHEGVSVFACLRDVDAYYADRPDEWLRNAKEAARRMKAALEVAVKKILEARQRPHELRAMAEASRLNAPDACHPHDHHTP